MSDHNLYDQFKPDIQQQDGLKTRLLQLYGLFAAIVLVTILLFAYFVLNQLEQDIKTADLMLAQLIARQLDFASIADEDAEAALTEWLLDNEADQPALFLLVSPIGQRIATVGRDIELPNDPRWKSWQQQTILTLLDQPFDSMIVKDPNAQKWLFSFASFSNANRRIVIQRSAQTVFATSWLIKRGLFIIFLLFLVGGVLFWTYFSRQVMIPLGQLESFSGLIRWRGQARPDEQANLNQLSQRQDRIGSLARSLVAMEQDIGDRFIQLATLLEMSRTVASSLDVAEVIDRILDQVQQLFNVEQCAVVVLDKRGDVFRIRASRELSDGYVRQLRIAPSEPNSPSMRALRNQEPIQVSNTETDLAYAVFRERARKEGFQSTLAIPMQTHYSPQAVLLLYKAQPYRYSFSELELASSFAHHASIALENAALYARSDERLQEQTRRLEAIVESLNDGLILESMSGEILYCNQQAADLCQLSRRTARRKSSEALMAQLLSTAVSPSLPPTNQNEGERIFELTQEVDNGRLRDLRITMFNVTDANGELLGRGQLWQDITFDKELDRMKSTLLSTVSHELRTPLATIKGYASTLLASDVEWDAKSQREFLETISNETDRLTHLVKNLLDMSRIESGLLTMHCDLYSLNELINQVVQSYPPDVGERLTLTLDNQMPPVLMDIPRVGTAVRNLLENAIKYAPSDSRIELTTARENGDVHFTVRDFGPGVPTELQDRIFDRFFRADNRLTRQIGGTGLGLAICKGFIEAHDGRVWVEPAHPGAKFGFALPIEPQNDY